MRLALLANVAQAFVARQDPCGRMLAFAASLCIVVNLVIFVVYTQLANAVTQNRSLQPENREALRRQWEYSHAVNGSLAFLAFCLTTVAALKI